MKRKYLLCFSLLTILALTGCSCSKDDENNQTNIGSNDNNSTIEPINIGNDYDYNKQITVEEPKNIEAEENTGAFEMQSSDGNFISDGTIYKITKAGTYTVSGKLNGQILIEAGEDDEVIIELNNASIFYDQDSPIKAVTADKVEISAKKDTENTVADNRSAKTVDSETQGEGAISAKCDLKLKGTGVLVVTGNYNNGVHTTKDLTIQKLTLKSVGYNNSLKGKDSITINSGTVQAFAKTGNGMKTEDSDISSKGNQRGTIKINGGTIYVDSLHDAIDASYNVEINEEDATIPTVISIKTGTNSAEYSKSTFVADSEKGLKAKNNIIVNKGTIVIAASDDAIHANYGDDLDNGAKGTGNVVMNDGAIKIASGDDGIHADNTLEINGGKVIVTGAKEGFEGNYIDIKGGYSYIYGSDDGVNCSKKSFNNCAFTMSGGYLDVAVKSGDTDGIDSNGDVTITGGVIISRGSPGTTQSGMSTGLDVDGTCSMTGGTLIAFNGLEKKPSIGSNINVAMTSNANSSQGPGGGPGGPGGGGGRRATSATYTFQAGEYCLSGNGINLNFTNDYVYCSFMIYSANLSINSAYTLTSNNQTILSWTQSSSSTTI